MILLFFASAKILQLANERCVQTEPACLSIRSNYTEKLRGGFFDLKKGSNLFQLPFPTLPFYCFKQLLRALRVLL